MNKYLYKKAITIPIYRGKLIIVLTNSKKKLKKYLPDFDDKNIYAHAYLEKYKDAQGFYIILNFNNDYRKIYHGTITHEAVHATNFIMNYADIEADNNNDESHAYLADWITDEVYKFVNKCKFKVEHK